MKNSRRKIRPLKKPSAKSALPPASNRAKPRRASPYAEAAPPHLPRLGLHGVYELAIPFEWTIQWYDPRLPAVLSTPSMIAMMEVAAANSVRSALPRDSITVGTRIEVDHLKAVPHGAHVRAAARLVEYNGRFLVFEVEAKSAGVLIGRGRVFRAIVDADQFDAKANSRAPSRSRAVS